MPNNVWGAPPEQLLSVLKKEPPPPKVYSSTEVLGYADKLSRRSKLKKRRVDGIGNDMEETMGLSETSEKQEKPKEGVIKSKKKKLIFGKRVMATVDTSESTKLKKKLQF